MTDEPEDLIYDEVSTQDTGGEPWPWPRFDAETLEAIRQEVATWPMPSSAQLDAVAALRPAN